MVKNSLISVAILAVVAISACSGDSGETEDRGSGIEGHSEAIIKTEDEVVDSLVALWSDAGASDELAECYAEFFREEGLAEEVQDLADLARVQSEFTDSQDAEFAACGPNTNPVEEFDEITQDLIDETSGDSTESGASEEE